jgi:hypothetical protein
LPAGYTYELPWTGETFEDLTLAVDSETEIVDLQVEVPRPVLFTVSGVGRNAVLRPGQLPKFLLQPTSSSGYGLEAVGVTAMVSLGGVAAHVIE